MVRTFHDAGIEVILDVVYNHTAEGNQLGPTINFRGIDNAAYYRLIDEDLRYYKDYTGTGNSLNARHPHTLQLIMDSLRYWVLEMHVDGFRFDLAATLARELHDVDRLSAFFDLVQQDPVVSQVKLIAEPWDVGEGGYQVGNFPGLWTEWNGKYRDTVRDYWRGDRSPVTRTRRGWPARRASSRARCRDTCRSIRSTGLRSCPPGSPFADVPRLGNQLGTWLTTGPARTRSKNADSRSTSCSSRASVAARSNRKPSTCISSTRVPQRIHDQLQRVRLDDARSGCCPCRCSPCSSANPRRPAGSRQRCRCRGVDGGPQLIALGGVGCKPRRE